MRRWIARTLITLATLAWLVVAYVYLKSSEVISQQHGIEMRDVSLSTQKSVIDRGERLAKVYGCFNSCHNENMRGGVVASNALFGKLVAPSLTDAMLRYTLPELEGIIRQGVKPDGTSVFGMPASGFSALTDDDFQAVLSFINQYPRQPSDLRGNEYGLLARVQIMTGELESQGLAARHFPWSETFRDNDLLLGEYLYTVTCSACHAADMKGVAGKGSSLLRMLDYNRYEFGQLLTLGAGVNGQELGEMSRVSRQQYQNLTDDEIDALYEYLKMGPQ